MLLSPAEDAATFRRHVVWLLIGLSAVLMTARLATVKSSRGGTAMLSANDRSRWSTIRALVDERTYIIDRVIFRSPGKRDPEWYTIDLVKHRGADGRQHYYSSKPTLLTTLFAGPYWLLHQLTGVKIAAQPFYVIRVSLLLLNVLPLVGFFLLLATMSGRLGAGSWSKLYFVAAAAFGTQLTTFAVTLNNHLPAAIFVTITTWAVLAIWGANEKSNAPDSAELATGMVAGSAPRQPSTWWFVVAGLSAALAAASELPALSFLALTGAIVALRSPAKTLLGFAPAALLVVVGAVGTNYLAHGTWSTPYAHRRDGAVRAVLGRIHRLDLAEGGIRTELRERLANAGIDVPPDATLETRPRGGYMLWDPRSEQKYALALRGNDLEVREWDNWYEYEGSYWSSGKKQGVDRGEQSVAVYALHTLVGHHGIFSLTPIWLLSVLGIGMWIRRGDPLRRGLAFGTAFLTIVCLVFFILLRPLADRNYGGVSCCFRWTVWLFPLWLLCLIPALEWIAPRPKLRLLAYALLAVSVFSAAYNAQNPWSHPWLYDYWTHLGWIRY